jgi:FMN phosphatase YigB (HAD superfamily)
MLIFDFDGVMIDSLDEVIVTAHNSVSKDLVKSLDDLPEGFEKVFRANRYHVQPAADFPVLAGWTLDVCTRSPDILLSRVEYRELLARDTEPPASRRNRFFAIRKVFTDSDHEAWLNLNRPYQPVWERLVDFGGANIVIMTNKNKQPVIALCQHFGLPVEAENIYSAEGGANKIDNLNAIHDRFRQDSYFFIDDSVPNLCDLDTHFNGRNEFNWILATWGYVGPGDRDEADRREFPCQSQEQFIAAMGSYA